MVVDPDAGLDDAELTFLEDLARRFSCQFVQLYRRGSLAELFGDGPVQESFADRVERYEHRPREQNSFILSGGHVVELYVGMGLHRVEEFSGIPTIPASITRLQHLEALCVGNVILVPPEIKDLPCLQYLWCDCVPAPRLPGFFFECPALQYLKADWADNLKELPDAFDRVPALRHLQVENSRRLRALPPSLCELEHLETLIIHGGCLTALPGTIGHLRGLRKLHINHNWLAGLPPGFTSLTRLEDLHLYHNDLAALPTDFGNLGHLKMLYLSSNHLTRLPESFGDLASLHEVHLAGNELEALPDLGGLSSLVNLSAHDNCLKAFPRGVASLQKLEQLQLSYNFITDVPPECREMLNLRELALDENPLTPHARSFLEGLRGKYKDLSF